MNSDTQQNEDLSLRDAIDLSGGPTVVAKLLGVSVRAIYKWIAKGTLPRTEYTGETQYSIAMAKASNGSYTASQLLESLKQSQAA